VYGRVSMRITFRLRDSRRDGTAERSIGGLQWESVWHIGLCYTWIALFAFHNINHGWTVYFLFTCFLLQTWSIYTGWPKNVIRSPLSIYSPNINRFKEFFHWSAG